MKEKKSIITHDNFHQILDKSALPMGAVTALEMVIALNETDHFNDDSYVVADQYLIDAVLMCAYCDNIHLISGYLPNESMDWEILWRTELDDEGNAIAVLTKEIFLDLLKHGLDTLTIENDALFLVSTDDGSTPVTVVKRCKGECDALHLEQGVTFSPN